MEPSITIAVVVWGILVTTAGILNWFRGDKLYKQAVEAKDAKIDLLSAEVERLKQITPLRSHQELVGQKEYYEYLLSKSQKAIDELGHELADGCHQGPKVPNTSH